MKMSKYQIGEKVIIPSSHPYRVFVEALIINIDTEFNTGHIKYRLREDGCNNKFHDIVLIEEEIVELVKDE